MFIYIILNTVLFARLYRGGGKVRHPCDKPYHYCGFIPSG